MVGMALCQKLRGFANCTDSEEAQRSVSASSLVFSYWNIEIPCIYETISYSYYSNSIVSFLATWESNRLITFHLYGLPNCCI